MMALRIPFDYLLVNLKQMHKMNEELINVLLNHKVNSRQVLMAKELTVLLLRVEKRIKFPFNGDENTVCACDNFNREVEEITEILNGFWSGDPDLGIKKIEDVKARKIIENQMILYEKIASDAKTILQASPDVFQFREYQSAIFRDSPELKSTLAKLNNHKLNTGLILLTLCSWLCVFACSYGYIRALKTK